jgi:hypothetical protein
VTGDTDLKTGFQTDGGMKVDFGEFPLAGPPDFTYESNFYNINFRWMELTWIWFFLHPRNFY